MHCWPSSPSTTSTWAPLLTSETIVQFCKYVPNPRFLEKKIQNVFCQWLNCRLSWLPEGWLVLTRISLCCLESSWLNNFLRRYCEPAEVWSINRYIVLFQDVVIHSALFEVCLWFASNMSWPRSKGCGREAAECAIWPFGSQRKHVHLSCIQYYFSKQPARCIPWMIYRWPNVIQLWFKRFCWNKIVQILQYEIMSEMMNETKFWLATTWVIDVFLR